MALMNLGAGLSAAGGAIAQQAGTEALQQQKADLEATQATLVNSMEAAREHAGRVETGQIQQGLQTQAEEAQSKIVGQQTASAEKIAGGEQSTQLKVAQTAANAQLTGIREQIEAAGTSLQFDQNNGQPVVVNIRTGKTAPLLGPDNKPMALINTGLVPVVQATILSNNEQARAQNQQFTTQMTALQKQYDDMGQNPLLKMDQKALSDARAPVQQQMDQLKQQNETVMESLRQSSAAAVSALYSKGATKEDIPPPGSTQGTPTPTPAQPAKSNTNLNQPPGGGTKADPYRPSSQAQIEWLKANGNNAFYMRPGDKTVYQVGGAAPAGQ